MTRPWWKSLSLALLLLACGKPNAPHLRTRAGAMPNENLPRELQPLPQPPAMTLEPLASQGDALSVTSARPQGPVKGEVRPSVTFSKPVKALEAVETAAGAPIGKLEPALEGEWRWLGSAAVEFVPKGLVPLSTAYRVTIFKGLKALDGSALAEDYVFSFETPRLELQKSAPVEGYAWVKPDETFELLFNQPVAQAELEAKASFRIDGTEGSIPLRVLKRKSIAEETREREAQQGVTHHEPLSAVQKGFENAQTRYTVQAAKPFPPGVPVHLTLPESLHGEQGFLTMKASETTWKTYGAFSFVRVELCEGQGNCPRGPLHLVATNPVDLSELKGRVKIEPTVEINWDDSSAGIHSREWSRAQVADIYLAAKLRPGTSYRVTVAPGATDLFRHQDARGIQATVVTDHLRPWLDTGGYLALVEKSSGARLPVEVVNLSSLKSEQWRLSAPELARVLGETRERDPKLDRPPNFQAEVPLTYPQDEVRLHPFDLSGALGKSATGTVYARLHAPELNPASYDRALVQITDLAVHLKVGPVKSLAWVSRLSTGGAVAGAKVTAYDSTGAVLWTGTSDANGFADVPGTLDLKVKDGRYAWEAPFVLVSASLDGDEASTADTWASGVEPYEFGLSQGWEGSTPESSGFLFTDRGIYRPGDDVFLKGVVRYRRGGVLKSPEPGAPFQLTVNDSKGHAILSQRVTVDAFGTFSTRAKIPPDAPTGYFEIEAKGDSGAGPVQVSERFRVEEYRAPQFKVDVRAERPSLVSGESLEAQVDARYLFGGAMANAKVKWSVQRSETSFQAPDAPGFSFEQGSLWDEPSGERQGLFSAGDGQVDAKGLLEIHAGKVEAPASRPYLYTVEAEVTDVNRQTIAGRASVRVDPASFYVGLRGPSSFFNRAKEPTHVDAVVVDTSGVHQAGRAVEVVIQRRAWKSVKKKTANGFTTVSEPVDEEVSRCKLQSAKDPVPCTFTPGVAGFYLARATVVDDAQRRHISSVSLYAIGGGFVSWLRDDTDRVELVLDKPRYKVGEVAHVLVKSPYTEANAVVTVEREGVLERRALKLVGSVNTVDLQVTEAMVPNIFMGVLLVHPRTPSGGIEHGEDPGRPAARVGLVKIPVDLDVKRLTVSVKTPRADYRPGETVEVDVDVHAHDGAPEAAQVTLFAVDDAILRLTSYVTPDPLSSIYPDRPLSVRLGEPLLNLVRHRGQGEKGEDAGGGGGERNAQGGGFRNNFKTTAVFLPEVRTDAQGHAHVAFKLPDNLTTFRIMAVVVSQKDRFGSGAKEVRVNKPLLALPALPRFARVGDHFQAGVVVHRIGAPLDVKVRATLEGAALEGPAEQTVNVSEASPREVRFSFVADRPGTATLRFAVSGGADRDGVESRIPVELPVEVESVATYGDTQDRRVEGISPPKDVRPGVGGLTVTMTSTALGNFQQGFQQLIEYPYGCLEQQSSRLVPFVALREIAGKFKVPWPGPEAKKLAAETEMNAWLNTYLFGTLDVSDVKDPDEVIRRTVRSIVDLQDGEGGFRYWPDSTCADPWQSAYASLALYRAHEVGFAVPAETLSKAQGFMTQVAGGACGRCQRHVCPTETRVFAAYVLSRMHVPKPSFYGAFFAERADLPLFSQAQLADMMFLGGGNRTQAKQLLQEILNHAKESPKGLHFEEVHSDTYATLFHSDTRTTGVVLQMLADVAPDHPFVSKLAHYLTSIRGPDGAWRSTQEAAFSLMALSEVVRTKERDTPNFKASVSMGSAPLFSQDFKGRSMKVHEQHLGMAALQKSSGGKAQTLSFQKEGPGVLYYSALLQYAPTALPMTPVDRGMYVERWFEPYTGGGQSLKFYAGDLVRVRVRISNNQERHYAAFEVPLPAGLEAIDTSLATSAQQTTAAGEEGPGDGYDAESAGDEQGGQASASSEQPPAWAYAAYSPFNHIERRDAKVVLFADHLPPGVHVSSFVARATTPGTFLLRPARGLLMYEPEVFGRSAGGTFEVVLPPAVSEK